MYPLWLGLLAVYCVGGWLFHRQSEDARRERPQILKAIDFLEKEIARLRERLPLSERDREHLLAITKQERPYRDTYSQ
jgi:hypothetical protein